MISKKIKQFCSNYQQIENYNEAINDNNETWDCHHRLELHDDYINTRDELKMMNLYYNRPPEELIFLKPVDHLKLHKHHKKKRANFLKKELKYPKMREARLKYYHGERLDRRRPKRV